MNNMEMIFKNLKQQGVIALSPNEPKRSTPVNLKDGTIYYLKRLNKVLDI